MNLSAVLYVNFPSSYVNLFRPYVNFLCEPIWGLFNYYPMPGTGVALAN